MIKTFIKKLLGKPASAPPIPAVPTGQAARNRKKVQADPVFGQRRDVPASEHGIDPGLIDKRALDVVTTLQDRGYEAYIVGGAVRDLLLGLRPKDFDVATNATPEQVKAAFRRAFIIGKRFRIVHVVFGRGREHEVIEVTTFRAYLDNNAASKFSGNEKTSRKALENIEHAVDASGRVLRDNVWGSMQEDAARRDFSINAMYYDPITQTVVDFHNGIADAHNQRIRMIGEPTARYREDPVRMLRAIRFAAKLGSLHFKLDAQTASPIHTLQGLLKDIPPSRMFDEMLKLLQTGHALATIAQLRQLGLEKGIYPLLDLTVARERDALVHHALVDTDRRVAEGKSVSPSYLLACVLWDDVAQGWQHNLANGMHSHPALQSAIDDVFDRRIGDVSGRGKLAADMREIWNMQPRFEKRSGKSPYGLLAQPRFRAGFDFLRLRAQTGQADPELTQWWEKFSLASEEDQAELLAQAKAASSQAGKTAKSRPKRSRQETDTGAAAQKTVDRHIQPSGVDAADSTAPAETTAGRAKKRPRRRKKPSNGATGNTGSSESTPTPPTAE